MNSEQSIARHYTHGALEAAILAALRRSGCDPERLTNADLAPVDQFHIGGLQATVDLADKMGITAGMHVLDIGCGLGGPSRHFAERYRCRVTGIDITEEYVQVAESLCRRTGLSDLVSYRQANATDLPFADGAFDAAYMLHVGMNIADKARLFYEVHRVLKPGGLFGVYDVMLTEETPLAYPVPWASGEALDFTATPAAYRGLLSAEGFEVIAENNRRAFAVEFFRAMQARLAQSGPPALGLQIVMGETAPQKVANMIALLEAGVIAPVEMICRSVGPEPRAGTV